MALFRAKMESVAYVNPALRKVLQTNRSKSLFCTAHITWGSVFCYKSKIIKQEKMATTSENLTSKQNLVGNESNMEKCYENYILVDIGANLTHKKFMKDLDSVIRRAKDSGVQKIMVTGTSMHCSKEALRLSRIYPGSLYCTVGVHPHDAKSWTDSYSQNLKTLALNPECVAIGECGLDYNRDFSPPDIQRLVFEEQVKLACELKKPLFIHEREAHDDLVFILNKHKEELPMAVVHCFTGTVEEAKKYLELGFYIGLTGFLCKDKSENSVRRLLECNVIPLDRLMVETDAPFMYPNAQASSLPPHVKQGLTPRSSLFLNRYCTFQRNEPCSLPAVVEMIAAFMNKPPEEVALATAFNALKLFGLSS